MRRILPLLLLFAVCLHMAWGWPSHMASHLPGQARHAAQGPSCAEADHEARAAHGEEHSEEGIAHAACAWCAAHAQQAFGLTPQRLAADPAQVHPLVLPRLVASREVHQAPHWPFASRDPPTLGAL